MRRAALCLLLPLLLAAAPVLGQEGGQNGGKKRGEKDARHVMVEVKLLEAQLEECEPIGVDFDTLLGELEPGLRFPSALDGADRRALLGEVGEASKRKPAVDDCGAGLQDKLAEVDGAVGGAVGGGQSGSGTGDSATSDEMLELVELQKRYQAAERRVNAIFGPRVRAEREARFKKILALAEELID